MVCLFVCVCVFFCCACVRASGCWWVVASQVIRVLGVPRVLGVMRPGIVCNSDLDSDSDSEAGSCDGGEGRGVMGITNGWLITDVICGLLHCECGNGMRINVPDARLTS